jgi:hypothetical protein
LFIFFSFICELILLIKPCCLSLSKQRKTIKRKPTWAL